jgi:hypothetical protein
MKLKTKIRAGKIRPNHNVTVHGTAASSQPKGRRRARRAVEKPRGGKVINPTFPQPRLLLVNYETGHIVCLENRTF